MAGFDLSNYKTVPERIAEARALYPDGRFQTELLVLPAALADKYIAVKARFFRCEADPIPGEGIAWEVVPGKTPYTKDSELQNAETSAWGRALVAAFAVDASKGIASREEVQNRQPEPRPRSGMKRTPNNNTVNVNPPSTIPPSVSVSPQSHEDAPRTNGNGDVGEQARIMVESFAKWTPEERADSYKRHSKAVLGGKPTDRAEVLRVIVEMGEEYTARFPGEWVGVGL